MFITKIKKKRAGRRTTAMLRLLIFTVWKTGKRGQFGDEKLKNGRKGKRGRKGMGTRANRGAV